jgi:predicted metalloprotease
MRWEGGEQSSNIEDRRGLGRTGLAVGGIGGLIVIVIGLIFGVDLRGLVGPGGPAPQEQAGPVEETPEEKRSRELVATVLKYTEEVWRQDFPKIPTSRGKRYEEPKLVLFREEVRSGCGFADAQVGPFYCPADDKVYLDLTFFQTMERQLKAGGDFAFSYVVAHEVGHHVQNLSGYSARADRARGTAEENRMSVRLELQADFLAGYCLNRANERHRFLERGDLEKGLNAAFQIGDDTLQKRGRGRVMPDKFTHGSSEQRVRWFKDGFEKGDLNRLDLLFELPYGQL